jgi:glycerol-3-phosphate dehydrogenase (NAD(P)+)
MRKIGVLGAGTIGMSLARMLYNSGNDILVWSAIESELVECEITHKHHNLPGMEIPEGIKYTRSIAEVCKDKDILMFAIPSVFIRQTIEAACKYIPDGQIIADVGKGIEVDTLYTISQIMREVLSKDGKHDNVKIVALSGPTHAEEIALDMPTTIVSGCEDMDAAREVQDVFMNTCMRVYTNADVLGLELCGALKNVIALACGVATGIGCGDNARAALITRGMAEITRLGVKMGCMEQTFYGLAGIGDLIVTATSMHSRNNRCGMLIGQGFPVKQAVKEVGQVVEGLNTLPAALQLAEKYDVEMPIVSALDKIVNEGAHPTDVVAMLMGRNKKSEVDEAALEKFFAARKAALEKKDN